MFHNVTMSSGGSRRATDFRVKTHYLARILPKSAWKWKKIDWGRRVLFDAPMTSLLICNHCLVDVSHQVRSEWRRPWVTWGGGRSPCGSGWTLRYRTQHGPCLNGSTYHSLPVSTVSHRKYVSVRSTRLLLQISSFSTFQILKIRMLKQVFKRS